MKNKKGGQTCIHEDIHSWESGELGEFKGKSWEVTEYAEAEVMESEGPSMTRLEAA